MIDVIAAQDRREQKLLTAEQIEKECPERLRQIAKEIKARLSSADKQTEQAQNHLLAVEQLLAEAKRLCDSGVFDKFRELFCPTLGKSQAYALLAIASGKKTIAEHRAQERERKQRTRVRLNASVPYSGTVPEKFEEESQAVSAGSVGDCGTELGETLQPELRRNINARDNGLIDFALLVQQLLRKVKGRNPERYAATSISVDDLETVGAFLTAVANLKKLTRESPDGCAAARILVDHSETGAPR